MSSKKRKKTDNMKTFRTYTTASTQNPSGSSSRDGKRARVVEVHSKRDGRLGQSQRFEQIVDGSNFSASSAPSNTDPYGDDGASLHYEQDDTWDEPQGKDGTVNDVEDEPSIKSTRQRLNPLAEWLPYRQRFLDELLHLDGRGDNMRCACEGCGAEGDGIFRCVECFGSLMVCRECVLNAHLSSPFHAIEIWDSKAYWRKMSLCALGLVVTLGHSGQDCIRPSSAVCMTVFHVNGLHAVNVRFCECGYDASAGSRYVQLLRARWFPATQTQPSSAFTMDVLDLFHAVTVQGKLSAHDFYSAVVAFKDNSGSATNQNRYHEFLKAARCYRHLKLAKRAGRGHDPSGIEQTRPGELALECPSCPHPGKNIPSNWESARQSDKWLYGQYLALDANFRLKMKDRAVKEDHELGPGWAYFVHDAQYKEELAKHTDVIEKSSCESTHQAIARATSRVNKGYSVTGVGTIICSRSGIVRGNGVADLQKGERYANMDYIFLSSLIGTLVMCLFVSYDIACQWSRKLRDRIGTYPPFMQLNLSRVKIRSGIPKFHISAHGASCQSKYSLNRRKFWGRTDGEGIERGWAHINPVAMSTREMGPGFRHDTLDDHWAAWNWYLIIMMGALLLKRLNEAVSYAAKQAAVLAAFSTSFTAEEIRAWTNEITAWEEDPDDNPDPFSEPESTKTMKTVQAELDREDCDDIIDDGDSQLDESMTATGFLCLGLRIEQQQCALAHAIKVSQTSSRTLKPSDLTKKRNVLYKRVRKLRRSQAVFMPRASRLGRVGTQENDKCERDRPEEITLFLPSSLPAHELALLPPRYNLVRKEGRLRIALGVDLALTLRHLLRVRTTMYRDKKAVATGQRENTRANSTIANFNDKIHRVAEQYRKNRAALQALVPNGAWSKYLKPLAHEHVQGPDTSTDERPIPHNQRDLRQRPSEGRKELSWIWLTNVVRANDVHDSELADLQDESVQDIFAASITANSISVEGGESEADAHATLKAEWCKTYARAERWKEEVVLLCEEMRRTLAFCEWKAGWWLLQATRRTGLTAELSDGVRAYAVKQAAVWDGLGQTFVWKWTPVICKHGLPQNWPAKYNFPVAVSGDPSAHLTSDSAALTPNQSTPNTIAASTSANTPSTATVTANAASAHGLPPGSAPNAPGASSSSNNEDIAANNADDDDPVEVDLDDIGLDDDGTLEDIDADDE